MNIEKEHNLLKAFLEDSPLYDITKFTTLDYPDNLASILWFAKCNMRCCYCYNSEIVFGDGHISIQKAIDFLNSRVNRLSGVVLSGGECTLYPRLYDFISEIKKLGFNIKIDTNGTNPKLIKELVHDHMIDYIALDYKAPKYKFEQVTHNKNFEDFEETLSFLINEDFPFEARTTIHSDLLDTSDINQIIDDLLTKGYKNSYFLQNYFHTDNTIGHLEPQKNSLIPDMLNHKIDIKLREF
ncbi:MAG: anaerobic ribonucleoside-triphosphate reductase activating protein [Sulfurospirillaceae bacterium]|nr:anaerobic ribonucleoside-triphosphate reductase activating protein [Sulfurospirillaceae bacterium]